MSKDDAAYGLMKVDDSVVIRFLNWKVKKYKKLSKEQKVIINGYEKTIRQLKSNLVRKNKKIDRYECNL